MDKHFINLTNGIEAIPFLDNYEFVRIPSTYCEAKAWDKLMLSLDSNFLMNLAVGNTCIIYDYSQKVRFAIVNTEQAATELTELGVNADITGTQLDKLLSTGWGPWRDEVSSSAEAFEKFGMQTDTTHISITDSELEQELGVIYDPVCIAVPYSAPNQENAVKWIKSLDSRK